jgi:BlaI family transcriptional regulator, penicillinase repressor
MKDSTVRTVLLRLEQKGYVTHDVDGRAYIYRASAPPSSVAASAIKNIIDRFCGGSAETLVMGLVDHKVVSPAQLKRLVAKIDAAEHKK